MTTATSESTKLDLIVGPRDEETTAYGYVYGYVYGEDGKIRQRRADAGRAAFVRETDDHPE